VSPTYSRTDANTAVHLSAELMIEAAAIFQDAVQFVLQRFGKETKDKVRGFVSLIVLQEKPYLMVTPDGLSRMINLVFSDEAYRDFVLTLHFTFASRWGMTMSLYQGLVANLAQGACPAMEGSLNAMPADMASRLSTYTDAAQLLEANPWLSMLLMLQLFVGLSD
jgi:hypothetical protein